MLQPVRMNYAILYLEAAMLKERVIHIQIERLPEGVYLATSDDIQGLVAQGRTVSETIEIARDIARKLIEAQQWIQLPEVEERFEYPIIIG